MKITRKKAWLIGLGTLLIILVVLVLSKNEPKPEYSTTNVISGPLVQTVSETGTIKPSQEVSLNFLGTGRISEIFVKVGDEVSAGTALASLDKAALEIKKLEAEAGIKMAEASLSKTLAGASSETVSVSRLEIEQAQTSENSARIDLDKFKKAVAENIKQAEKTLRDLESSATDTATPQEQAVLTAQTALDNTKKSSQRTLDNSRESLLLILSDKILVGKIALDNLNTLLEDDDVENVLGVKNSSTLSSTENSRLLALNLLPLAEEAVLKAKSTKATYDINAASNAVKNFLSQSSLALNYAYSMLEATITWAEFSQTELDAYKTLVSSQNTQVGAATTAIENSLQAFNNAQTSYDTSVAAAEETLSQAQVNLENAIITARNNLSNLRLSGDQQIATASARLESAIRTVALARAKLASVSAPARAQDIALAEAQLSQARASLASLEKQINDSILSAPLSGVITQVNYEIGEQVGVGAQPMIKMLAENNFVIELDISESDINKVKVGNSAEITLDAFSEDVVFVGSVSFIEPAQTLIQDVVYYKVKIEFNDLEDIKSDLASKELSLKAGMTANVSITTDKRDNVMQVPARAIIDQDGRKIVRILSVDEVIEVPVEVGLRGDDGLTEIKSGLMAGDEVITFIKTNDK